MRKRDGCFFSFSKARKSTLSSGSVAIMGGVGAWRPRVTEIAKGIHMCGYVCIGCGRCRKPRTMELPDVKCLKCGALNEPGAARCSSCGATFAAPGASGSKVAVKAKAAR